MMPGMKLFLALGAASSLFLLGACGDTAPVVQPATTVTQTVTQLAPPAAPATTAPTTTTTTAPATAPPTTTAPTTRAPQSSGIEVPDVVGLDHQLAQDTLQSAGLYNLVEEDATGQGRALLFDRNWVVVRQAPAAGSKVDAGAQVLLESKKIGE